MFKKCTSLLLRDISSSSSFGAFRRNTDLIRNLRIGVLGAPFNKGQRQEGVKEGPSAITNTGLLTNLKDLGCEVVDYGEIKMQEPEEGMKLGPDGERYLDNILQYCQRLSDAVSKVVKDGSLCLTLGGDHSIAIGTINGHAQANPDHQVVVLWVDAHSDINTGASSGSGNVHGMPVSFHLREVAQMVNRLPDSWPQPCISASHIAFIGLRDVDDAERDTLSKLGILNYSMQDIDQLGLSEVIKKCLDHLQPSSMRPLHVSFDIDALDPLEAPSTGTAVRGGLTIREGLNIVEAARNSGCLQALDLVEVNPKIGSDAQAALTADAARLIILAAAVGYRGA